MTKKTACAWIGGLLLLGFVACSQKIEYPVTKKVDVVDDYHGTQVTDSYRWLEDDNAEETKAWVEAQNKVTFAYLSRIPAREKIQKRLTELWNYEKFDVPFKQGGLYFFQKNDGLQNQSVLYVQESLDAQPRKLLDPNTLSEDGTIALTTTAVSRNGKNLAYGLSSGGSDWREFHVRDIASGADLDDHVRWVKFSDATWSHDSKGFYYARYDQPQAGKTLVQSNKFQKVFYHKIGIDQAEDELIYDDRNHPDRLFGVDATDDGKYLIVYVREGSSGNNRVYYMKLGRRRKGNVVRLLDKADAQYRYVDNDGPLFYFYTNLDAPKGRIIAIHIDKPQPSHWREIISEQSDALYSVQVIHNQFVMVTMHDAYHQIKIYNKNGSFDTELPLPTLGSVRNIEGNKDDDEMFFDFASFAYHLTIYRYDFTQKESTVFQAPSVDFSLEDYETKQVFFKSKDGMRVPMFLTYKKGIEFRGKTPTYLYGYGGFNISSTPRFDVSNVLWMEMGGIYALVNLRGGGEYGEEWHEQGILENKQNVFDDFIAAAEYLISEGYTSSEKLAIGGASNGGLLVGACMIQRPDLYGAALPAVGVMDMLRYHTFTIGWAWASDYGRSDNPDHFPFIYAYSPLHNLKEGVSYPATLVTTADHDDRVVPAHSFKFAARLQECHTGDAPVLIRIETRAGHGAGKPTSKRIEEQADKWAFLLKNLRMTY